MSDDADFYRHKGFDALLAAARMIELSPGDALVRQGDASGAAWFLAEGAMGVYAETPYGEAPLATLEAPRLIGEIGALAGLPRTASIRAKTAARLHEIDRAQLVAFGRHSPDLLLAAVEQLGRQIATVNEALGLYGNALKALEERSFDERILADLDNPPPALATFAAVFHRFAREIAGKRRHQDEMASAAMIQRSFLPKDDSINSKRRDVRVAASIRPTREVGGDFYDFFTLDETRLAFVTGDVCGKGPPASLFAARVLTLLRTLGRDRPEPADVIARANELLCEENDAAMFATAFFGVLDLRSGDLSYCNCGHVAPFHLTPSGEIHRLRRTGLPLAIDAGLPAAVATTRLSPGDKLMLITDGVTEATDVINTEFGEERLLDLLGQAGALPPAALVEQVFSAVDAFAQSADQADDIACLIIERPIV
jgi:phosphoserine phosphatase RsbU/P